MVITILRLAFLVMAASAALSSAVVADELPTPEQVEAHIFVAEGPAIGSYRKVEETQAFGLVLRSVEVRSGSDFRIDLDEGPIHVESGSLAGQRWRQNANGQTILEQPGPGLVRPETQVASVARITTPVDGYLLSSLDARGLGIKRYVEAATWRVVRQDVVTATETQVTTFDDFRTVAGHTEAFHRKKTDGHVENDSDTHVVELTAAKIAAAQLAIPAPRRALVEFPAGKTVVDVPVRLDRGKIIVRVDAGGRGLDFILDSGAAGIALDEGVAKQLRLTEFGSFSNAANAGRIRGSSAIVPLMKVGELTMRDVVVGTIPFSEQGDIGDYRAVGLLGFDFIGALALKLDYHNARVTAYDPTSFTPPDESHGFDLDIRLGSGQPLTSITVNGAIAENFLIDTGSAGGIIFTDRFARRNPDALVDEGGGARMPFLAIHGVGGGNLETRAYQLKEVRIGSTIFRNFVAYSLQSRQAYDASGFDGTIGPEFLRFFDVYFDYSDSKVYLIFNADANPSKVKS